MPFTLKFGHMMRSHHPAGACPFHTFNFNPKSTAQPSTKSRAAHVTLRQTVAPQNDAQNRQNAVAVWQRCPGSLPPYANLNQSLFYVLIDHQRAAYLSHKYGPTLAAFLQHYSTILTAFCPCSHLIMVSFCCRFSCCIPTKFGQHFPPIFGYSFYQSLP